MSGFDPKTYSHVLPEGEEDFDDFTEEDLQEDPELGYSDAQVEAEVAKMTEDEKQLYGQLKEFTDSFYRQHGYIIPLSGIIKLYMTGRYPEIPTQTAEEQAQLWEDLMAKIRKREASEEASLRRRTPTKDTKTTD